MAYDARHGTESTNVEISEVTLDSHNHFRGSGSYFSRRFYQGSAFGTGSTNRIQRQQSPRH
jgi:hypothetical protein